MSEKYIAFIPEDWRFVPSDEERRGIIEALVSAGIISGDPSDPESLRNGPAYETLFRDTDPKPAVDGEGMGCDPGRMVVHVRSGEFMGFAGDNLSPVACNHCDAELPYEEAQDAFYALKDGEGPESPRLQMECYHCGEHTPAVGADFANTGGFASFAIVFEGETSNRIEVDPRGLEQLGKIVGKPMTWVQVHGW